MCVCVLIIMHNGVLCVIPSYICMNYYTLIKKKFRASHGYTISLNYYQCLNQHIM